MRVLNHYDRFSFVFVIFFLTSILSPALVWASPRLYANKNAPGKKVLLVAAASNLRFVMDEIAIKFERESGSKVKISYGSSGSLFVQVKAGAPYDLFFSADQVIPMQLIQEGFSKRESFFLYGIGQIVLWVPKQSVIDLEKERMKALIHPSVHKIAIANPRHAPYGAAAISALKKSGIFQSTENKLILGENVSHAAQFVAAGGAEIGILSYSLVIASPLMTLGRYWKIPSKSHPDIVQAAVILMRSPHPALSRSFMDFIRDGPGKSILIRYGLLNGNGFQ